VSGKLRIAADLTLPLDAITQKFAFLGRSGAGKTYGAGKFVEELLDAGAQVVILDPVGNWFGLRLAADGKLPAYLARMRSAGWIEDRTGKVFITATGLQALGPFDELPTGRALLDYWLNELGSGAARMLKCLYDAAGPLSKAELGERTGLSSQSGSFGTHLSRLRSLELISGRGDALIASEIFYE
jgi:Helicase HerA, central domain